MGNLWSSRKPVSTTASQSTAIPTASTALSGTEKSRGNLASHGASPRLEDQPYYHGKLPREDIVKENLLIEDGDFIVRESDRHVAEPIIISVLWQDQIVHIPLKYQTNKQGRMVWQLGKKEFLCLAELVDHYVRRGTPIGARNAVLRYGVPKDEFQLNHDDVQLLQPLGSGHYGEVWRGKLKKNGGKTEQVAVKLLKSTAQTPKLDYHERQLFLAEARTAKRCNDSNVVKLMGICIMRDPPMLVMELVEGDSLDKYLVKYRGRTSRFRMLKFCADACRGMAHLEEKQCIHRDLAARNCLVSAATRRLKITDFGMSRAGEVYKIEQTKKIPVRWTAPEAITFKTYTSKSDVWSFGVLMWEIYSEGLLPYPDMDNRQVIKAVKDEGFRMAPPKRMPPGAIKVMNNCWKAEPEHRPTFAELKEQFKELLKNQ